MAVSERGHGSVPSGSISTMGGLVSSPAAFVPVGAVTGASVLWRTRGRLHVTTVVKATFEMVADGVMVPVVGEPIDPTKGELAPYLGQADVVLRSGHVYALPPRAVSALALRLAVVRDWPVIDKKVLVYPQRPTGAARMPVVVERLAVAVDGREAGTLVNPADPSRPASLTALGAGDAERLAILDGRGAPSIRGATVEIEDMFPWSYYQTAPTDQRTDHLRGDEWVILEGFHPRQARWSSRLPGAQAQVIVLPPNMDPSGAYPVAMAADMLVLDPDRARCSVLWRGSFGVRDEASARAMALVGGLALPGRPIPWPDRAALLASPIVLERGLVRPLEDEDSLAETLVEEGAFDPSVWKDSQGEGGIEAPARSLRVPRGSLELTADGALGVIELGDDDIVVVERAEAGELEEPETVALSKEEGERMRAALERAAAQPMLRPAPLEGLPWTPDPVAASEVATSAPAEASLEDDAPELEAYTIDSLELTLSESLAEHGFGSLEELQALLGRGADAGDDTSAK